MSPLGRPEGAHRRAQPEGAPPGVLVVVLPDRVRADVAGRPAGRASGADRTAQAGRGGEGAGSSSRVPEGADSGTPTGTTTGTASGLADNALPDPPVALCWAWGSDGRTLQRSGRSLLAELPRADRTVLVCGPRELAWHRPQVPPASAAQMPRVLAGLLEDQVLQPIERLHLALGPGDPGGATPRASAGSTAGAPSWVAAVDRAWLSGWLDRFSRLGHRVEAVVPLLAPRSRPALHLFGGEAAAADQPGAVAWAVAMDRETAWCLPLSGRAAAEQVVAWGARPGVRWSATRGARRQAQRLRRQPVPVVDEARAAWAAARRRCNLLQFDLAPPSEGRRLMRSAASLWRDPAWRSVRWGLAAVLLLNLVGLNWRAEQARQALQARQREMVRVLQLAHPEVRTVVDAPRQMQAAHQRLSQGDGLSRRPELARMLLALAQAWPEGAPALSSWHYGRDRLKLDESSLSPEAAEAMRPLLARSGWYLERRDGQWQLGPEGGRALAGGVGE